MVAALLLMGIAGEIAYERADYLGSGSFHDAISRMDAHTLLMRAKYDEA
ncbi:MAG: hypothetical protein LBS00_01340 [Synergistaceae bacterium]|nr:hypothetical protein [Synergistaceae bacterium]